MSEEFEALLVREALREADGSIAAAARLLGVPRPTLHAKVQRHGIRVESRVDLPGGFDAEE